MAKQKKETAEEKESWERLYYYVKDNIMGYDENQALSREMVLRLKGLLNNKFMANNNIKNTANYSYDTILATFKYCYTDIQKALRTNRFNNDMHRFNFVLKIVERNINNVYMKIKTAKKAKEEAKAMTIETTNYIGAEYQRKTKDTSNKRLDDLW